MEKVAPYKNINDAMRSLDNGGRFYNLFTKAEDGLISQAELSKIGGIFNDKQKAVLFLEVSLSKLKRTEKEIIISKLDEKLRIAYVKYKAQNLLPSEVPEKGILSSNIILTGIPKLIDSKADFNGFIMIPIMVDKITMFSMIPLIDAYDVYELRDKKSSETFIIAHSKSSKKLPSEKMSIAGVLKKLEKNEKEKQKTFLEASYHSMQ
jgi:hypothetical protein